MSGTHSFLSLDAQGMQGQGQFGWSQNPNDFSTLLEFYLGDNSFGFNSVLSLDAPSVEIEDLDLYFESVQSPVPDLNDPSDCAVGLFSDYDSNDELSSSSPLHESSSETSPVSMTLPAAVTMPLRKMPNNVGSLSNNSTSSRNPVLLVHPSTLSAATLIPPSFAIETGSTSIPCDPTKERSKSFNATTLKSSTENSVEILASITDASGAGANVPASCLVNSQALSREGIGHCVSGVVNSTLGSNPAIGSFTDAGVSKAPPTSASVVHHGFQASTSFDVKPYRMTQDLASVSSTVGQKRKAELENVIEDVSVSQAKKTYNYDTELCLSQVSPSVPSSPEFHSDGEKSSVCKDPSKLKRPMNSFLLFSNEVRPVLQAQYPDLSNSDISKLLGTRWNMMPTEEKNNYMKRAAEVKAGFMAAHPDFVYTKAPSKRKKAKSQTREGTRKEYKLQTIAPSGMVPWMLLQPGLSYSGFYPGLFPIAPPTSSSSSSSSRPLQQTFPIPVGFVPPMFTKT